MKSKSCILSSNDQAALAMWLGKRENADAKDRRRSQVGMHWALALWGLSLAAGAACKGAMWRLTGQSARARAGEIAVLERMAKIVSAARADAKVEQRARLQEIEEQSLRRYESAARLWSIARAQRALGAMRSGGVDEQCQELEGALGALIGQLQREDWQQEMGSACSAIKSGRVLASFAPKSGLPELSRVAHDALALRMEIEELPESLQESFCALQKLEVSWMPPALAPKESSGSKRL